MKKKLILMTILLSNHLFSQKTQNSIEIELLGPSGLYNVGLGTYFSLKDSSKIGFKVGLAYVPFMYGDDGINEQFTSTAQVLYNPKKFINGKFDFRAGTTFYFMDSYSNTYSDPNFGAYTYNPATTYNSFNLGVSYNVLKSPSKIFLKFGLDGILAYRDLTSNHVDIPIFPWPHIVYGVKF